jgi:hypothetical protein
MADDPDKNAVKAFADTVKATVDAIKAVEDSLTSERAVVLEIDNVSGFTLTFESSHHDHGGFQDTPPFSILDKQSALFSSQSSGLFVGTEGRATYTIDGVNRFTVKWDNPFVGNNSTEAIVEGVTLNRFIWDSITGNGNHAHARFLVGARPAPYSVRNILQGTGTDLSKGLRQFFPSPLSHPQSLRAFVQV